MFKLPSVTWNTLVAYPISYGAGVMRVNCDRVTTYYSEYPIIRMAVCHYKLNTARISELVWISEKAIYILLHYIFVLNRRHNQ